MRTRLAAAAAALVLGAGLLAGCAGGSPASTPVTEPIIMEAGDLQNAEIVLKVGQVLSIETGSLAPDSYSAEIGVPDVAEFVQGGEKDGAEFNPGIKGLAVGETGVLLTNEDGGIPALEFVVTVTE